MQLAKEAMINSKEMKDWEENSFFKNLNFLALSEDIDKPKL